MAETYHVYNYRSLPLSLVATFCVGLGENSRVVRNLTGNRTSMESLLLALIIDDIRKYFYNNKSIPSVYELLQHIENKEKKKKNVMTFRSGEDFMKAWK